MNPFQAFLLGAVQGLTEFLPISSSGHLILVSSFFHIPSGLSFDAFIHLGSFLAILVYFRKELKEIWRLKWLVFIAFLPGALAGFFLEDLVSSYFRHPATVGLMLLLMSLPMVIGEKMGKKVLIARELSYLQALIIGIFQSLAIIPGTSRSGITISAGLLVGLKRDEAARFSFIVGAPLILGAGCYEGLKMLKHGFVPLDVAGIGFFSSAVFSFFAINFLIPFLKRHSLYPFVIYRVLLALFVIAKFY